MNYNAIWISDVHLGSRHAQVDALLDFLRENEAKHIYIVGDFFDGWELKRSWYWLDQYNVLIQKLLRKSRKHTKVTLIYGNHDEFLQQFRGLDFGPVRLVERAIHVGLDGKRYLVLHGHQFDGLTQFNRLLERVGSQIYDWILNLNLWVNYVRRSLGFGHWSFASYLKMQAKGAVKYVTEYEEAMVQMAAKLKVQGVICGHIHRAEIKPVGDIVYMNCGDWVESCTALAEDLEGNFKLINYANHVHSAGRGPRAHDPGHLDESDLEESGARDGGGAGREAEREELAGVL